MTAPILYVDDDPANLVVLEAGLGSELPVITAGSGEEALGLIRSRDIAVLLTDQRMPGMTGVELTEAARLESPDTVRIIVTAYSDLQAAIEAINRGRVHLYVRKPWDLRELRIALKDARERYLVARRLRELERRLVATERVYALGVVAAGLAHELRNPLGSVRVNVESARMNVQEVRGRLGQPRYGIEQAQEALGDVVEALADAERAVDSIVEIIRGVELSTRSSQSGAVDLVEVVKLTSRAVRGELHHRGRLQLELPASALVRGSRTQLGQVVLNLVVNALEALDPERRGANLVAVRLAADDAGVRLVVEDNGPGIPAAVAERIFDPFFTTKEEGGTGLGLAISRKIVEEHGGTVEVQSVPGEGTRFVVALPRGR